MQQFDSTDKQEGFEIVGASTRSQAATMTLAPGESTGGPDNRHPESDQWLLVLSGEGKARVDESEITLKKASLVLIEAGETHEILNSGSEPLKTVNIYSPPAYRTGISRENKGDS